MKNLLRLIYTSRATVPFDAAALESLLVQARRKNYDNGITGVLSFSHGHFLQVLEGPESEVLRLYARILNDSRHRACVIIAIQLIQTRLCPNWTMSHARPNPKVGSQYNELLDYRTVTDDFEGAQRLLDDLFEIVME
jgi:hypothetical protein